MGSWVHTSLSFTAIALLHLLVLVSGRKPTGARRSRSRSSETSTGTCDFFNGRWVLDEEEYPLYHPSTCPFIEREFSCEKNGRADQDYTKYRWQPHDYNIVVFLLETRKSIQLCVYVVNQPGNITVMELYKGVEDVMEVPP
ncbi:hypothetical protein ACLB2K_023157 [Fragaria x ananassa]